MHATAISSEFVNLKARLKKTWMAGDYDRFSRYMENGARDFYERLDAAPGAHFLDVACGSGQLALIAARDGLEVTGVDIARNLVERARQRAQAEGFPARFEEADAEALPFEDASFDIVASLVGAMFAPRPELVAQELLRVCSPGGTLAMVNWTPQGFIGQMFKAVSNSLRRPECPRRCCGATKPQFVKGSAKDSWIYPWSDAITRSAIPFLPQRWWSSSASTTDPPTRRLLLSIPPTARIFAGNSRSFGLLTIEPAWAAPRSWPNIWK
jgi:ubiquinone/menaquinone biosynthesis C-methylase UbiE